MLKGTDIEKLFKGINLEGAKGVSTTFRSFTPEPIEKHLIDAVKRGAKDIAEVSMWQGKAVEVVPGELKTLYTFGLCGCQATAIIAKGKNGNPIAIMTHFPPISLDANLSEINRLVRQNAHLIDDTVKPKVAYVLPGQWATIDGKYAMDTKDKTLLEKLKKCVQAKFPQGVEETVLPYNECKTFGQSSAFVIDFPSTKGKPINYQACGEHYGNFGEL